LQKIFSLTKTIFSEKVVALEKAATAFCREGEREGNRGRYGLGGRERERENAREKGTKREKEGSVVCETYKRWALTVTPASLRYLSSVSKHKLYSIITCQIKALLCYQK